MIGILVFLFCLVNIPIVHGMRTLREGSKGLETITNVDNNILHITIYTLMFFFNLILIFELIINLLKI